MFQHHRRQNVSIPPSCIQLLYCNFHEICNLAICVNITAFNRVNRKQPNILKIFLEYQENYIVAWVKAT